MKHKNRILETTYSTDDNPARVVHTWRGNVFPVLGLKPHSWRNITAHTWDKTKAIPLTQTLKTNREGGSRLFAPGNLRFKDRPRQKTAMWGSPQRTGSILRRSREHGDHRDNWKIKSVVRMN
jgi:hypothetical protein